MAIGYAKEIIRKTVSVTKQLSGEAIKAMEAHDLKKEATGTAGLVVDKIVLDMKNVITYGQAVSYVDNGGFLVDTKVGDGKSLFNDTHTLKNSTKTYSNVSASNPSLSEDALPEGQNYFRDQVMDNYGKVMKMKPNVLITTSETRMVNRANRLLKSISPEKIEGGVNGNSGVINVNKARLQHLEIDFDVDAMDTRDSSKTFWWGLASVGKSEAESLQAHFLNWLSPTVTNPNINEDTWSTEYTGRTAYGLGVVSGKGIWFSFATN